MPSMLGKRFSRYEVLEKIGTGGMGDVYRARDADLGREVAVKFLPERFATDPRRLTRFAQEARSASSLNHPNIVTVHEIGEMDGLPYIVMELVRGQTLRDLLTSRPLPARRALDLAVQVADGLAKAHGAGIVHRDLKPENFMITDDGYLKILDFGLAKLFGDSDERPSVDTDSPTESGVHLRTPDTDPGAILGTVGYMSPEQAKGHSVDFRGDQFTCGAIFYEMLTGRRAFQRETPAQTLAAIIEGQPEPISSLNPSCPPPVRWIIERCLAKEPGERYASTLDLARELKNVREHLGEVGTSAPSGEGLARVPRRRGRWVAAALALLGLAGLAAWPARERLIDALQLRPIPPEKHLAILPFAGGGSDPASQAFSDGLAETLTSKITQLEQFQGSLWVVPATEVRQAGVTSAAAARRTFGVTLVITGSVRRAGDRVRLTANLVDAVGLRQLRAMDLDRRTEDAALLQDGAVQRIVDMLELEIGPRARRVIGAGGTNLATAHALYLEGRGFLQRYEKAESLESAIASFQHALEQDPGYALAYAGQGEAHWRLYELTKRPELVELAQKSCRRAMELNDLLAPVHVTLGLVHAGTGRHLEAVEDFKRALDLDPASTDGRRELAKGYEALGRFEEAEAAFKKAIDLKPGYWAGYSHLGAFYARRGRYAEGEASFRKVIELTPDNVRGYTNLGAVDHLLGRDDEAEVVLQKAVALRPTAWGYSNLATVQFFRGHYADAARAFEGAVRLDDRDARVWRNLGAAYYWTPGERDRARAAYERAAALGEQERQVNPRDATVLIGLADCYAMLGQAEKARRSTIAALDLAPRDVDVVFRAGSVYEQLGDRKQALAWIGRALRQGFSVKEVEHAPDLAALRADPHFPALRPGPDPKSSQGGMR